MAGEIASLLIKQHGGARTVFLMAHAKTREGEFGQPTAISPVAR
jgi:hypothetical protein